MSEVIFDLDGNVAVLLDGHGITLGRGKSLNLGRDSFNEDILLSLDSTITRGSILYGRTNDILTALAPNITTTRKYLSQIGDGSGVLGTSWEVVTAGGGSVTSVSGTANRISMSGTASDPVIDIASTYIGQSSITTLGTITTGVWDSTALLASKVPNLENLNGLLTIGKGGTGQVTANAALNALLPSQTSQATKFLQTDGSNASWQAAAAPLAIGSAIGSSTVGSMLFVGASNLLQQNNFNLFWNEASHRLGLGTTTPETSLEIMHTGDNALRSSYSVWPTTAARNDFTGCTGYIFTLIADITISELGRYYISGNTQNHIITIWSHTTQTAVASGTVLAASSSDTHGFKWVSITPVVLSATTTYSIMVDETSGGDTWTDLRSDTNSYDMYVTRVGYGYGSTSSFPSSQVIGTLSYNTGAFKFTPSVDPQIALGYDTTHKAFIIVSADGNTNLTLIQEDKSFGISKLRINKSTTDAEFALDVGGKIRAGGFTVKDPLADVSFPFSMSAQTLGPGSMRFTSVGTAVEYVVLNSGTKELLLNFDNPTQSVIIGATVNSYNSQLGMLVGASGTKGITIRGATSQTADFQEWQEPGGNTVGRIDTTGHLYQAMGSTLSLMASIGVANVQTSSGGVGNAADTTDDTLFTYSLPLNAMSSNGTSLRAIATGHFATNANTKQVKFWFAGTAIADSGALTLSNTDWTCEMEVSRIDSTHVSCKGVFTGSNVASVITITPNLAVSSLVTNNSIVKITGASTIVGAANDILGYMMKTWFEN